MFVYLEGHRRRRWKQENFCLQNIERVALSHCPPPLFRNKQLKWHLLKLTLIRSHLVCIVSADEREGNHKDYPKEHVLLPELYIKVKHSLRSYKFDNSDTFIMFDNFENLLCKLHSVTWIREGVKSEK